VGTEPFLFCFVVAIISNNNRYCKKETLVKVSDALYSGSLVRDIPQLATGLVCTLLVTLTARGSGTVYTYLYPLSIYIGTRNRVKLQFCFI
jgi:hypothetical protein